MGGALLGMAWLLTSLVASAGPPTLTASGDSGAGYLTLTWEEPPGSSTETAGVFELESATDRDFRDAARIYRGRHMASLLSGLEDGTYWYRVRRIDDDASAPSWSKPVEFRVEHHSLALAGGLFALGALVFGLTASVIVRKREDP
jgi:hypothetical protein